MGIHAAKVSASCSTTAARVGHICAGSMHLRSRGARASLSDAEVEILLMQAREQLNKRGTVRFVSEG